MPHKTVPGLTGTAEPGAHPRLAPGFVPERGKLVPKGPVLAREPALLLRAQGRAITRRSEPSKLGWLRKKP